MNSVRNQYALTMHFSNSIQWKMKINSIRQYRHLIRTSTTTNQQIRTAFRATARTLDVFSQFASPRRLRSFIICLYFFFYCFSITPTVATFRKGVRAVQMVGRASMYYSKFLYTVTIWQVQQRSTRLRMSSTHARHVNRNLVPCCIHQCTLCINKNKKKNYKFGWFSFTCIVFVWSLFSSFSF